jgi:hypothetical protein
VTIPEGFTYEPHRNVLRCERCNGELRLSDVARLVEAGADAAAIRCACVEKPTSKAPA